MITEYASPFFSGYKVETSTTEGYKHEVTAKVHIPFNDTEDGDIDDDEILDILRDSFTSAVLSRLKITRKELEQEFPEKFI